MSFQSPNLILRGKGIPKRDPEAADTGQASGLPQPIGGLHLRWFFAREIGFPRYGYHIFRRPHTAPKWKRLSENMGIELIPGVNDKKLSRTKFGTFRSNAEINELNPTGNISQIEVDPWQWISFDIENAYLEESDNEELAEPVVVSDSGFELNLRLRFLNSRIRQKLAIYVFQWDNLLERRKVISNMDGTINARFSYDTITRIEIKHRHVLAGRRQRSFGKVIIEELSYLSVMDSYLELGVESRGWEVLQPGSASKHEHISQNPICLPVAEPTYPCGNTIGSAADAYKQAARRISYGQEKFNEEIFINGYHPVLQLLVKKEPQHLSMAERLLPEDDRVDGSATLESRYAIDLIMAPSIQPAIGQVLGLYLVESTAVINTPYDYLIIASHVAGQIPPVIFPAPDNQDIYLIHNVRVPTANKEEKVEKPRQTVAYALPQGAGGDPNELAAALTWSPAPTTGDAGLDGVVLYHVWRRSLGQSAPAQTPANNDYELLTKPSSPVLHVERSQDDDTWTRPPNWPPVPIAFIDRKIEQPGWHSYRVTAIDMYGRHSDFSAPVQWKQWTPAPDPKPWYYDDDIGDGRVVVEGAREASRFAVRLIDLVPPPVPSAVEGQFLDPEDPTLRRDEAVEQWLKDNINRDGTRVKWHFPDTGTDCNEFRIYFYPRNFNSYLGLVESSATNQASESLSTQLTLTGIEGFSGTNFSDCQLQINQSHYRVENGERLADGTLKLTVLADHLPPIEDFQTATLEIGGENSAYRDASTIPAWRDTSVTPAQNNRLAIIPYNEAVHYSLEIDPEGSAYRQYDIILPIEPNQFHAHPLSGMAYGSVGVSSADASEYTRDVLDEPNRHGNESKIGGPAKIYRVDREPPGQPELPVFPSDRLFASEPDYQQHSFYTFSLGDSVRARWMHVYRALNRSLFEVDFNNRSRERDISDDIYPAEWLADPSRVRISTILQDLSDYDEIRQGQKTAAKDYFLNEMSDDLRRLIASLPENKEAFSQITATPIGKYRDGEHIDTIVGRGKGIYFYRAAFLSASQVIGAWSVSTPPVYVPDTRLPAVPRILKTMGGDRSVTLSFDYAPKDKVVAYEVYRTNDTEKAQDIRLMGAVIERIDLTLESSGGDNQNTSVTTWIDSGLPAPQDYYYCVTAIRLGLTEAGEIELTSAASNTVRVRTFATSPPLPPRWIRGEWVDANKASGGIKLRWSKNHDFESITIQRRNLELTNWRNIAHFGSNQRRTQFFDKEVDANASYAYRILGTDAAGKETGSLIPFQSVPLLKGHSDE